MRSIEQLTEDAQDPRLRKQPQWVEQLVYELGRRLELEHRAAEGARTRALEEVTEARALLTGQGPADADTFMSLPRALYDDNEGDLRPLGRGTTVEFRPEGAGEGEGFEAKLKDGELIVGGVNALAVVPVYPDQVKIVRI